ncbi:flavin-containing monooxygenase [Nocardiopsis salina]|uniref:flavin-containing monooxygenase n=1 Tax=Nocardiopsis salina TaxID=245836 RepID=UPI00034512D1|nr:NAD(P)/FAD-dependent oxidoreductase [Nocardiopsis salina]
MDLEGKRVVVVGTGSTGIQLVPEVARRAAHTTVLQRTANYAVPSRNRRYAEGEFDELRADYPRVRQAARENAGGLPYPPAPETAEGLDEQQRRAELDERWQMGGLAFLASFGDALVNRTTNDVMADYVRDRVRETVEDPETADLLCPDDHPLGSKRICVESGYHAAFNRDDVSLVSVRERPVEGFTRTGIVAGGAEHAADVVVMATGFDAITGPYLCMDLRGRDGVRLADRWEEGPLTYLGVATSGFPNLFMLTGPGSPSVLGNVLLSIEQHVEWVSDYIAHLEAESVCTTEPAEAAEREWTAHVAEVASYTVYPEGGSWYMGANLPGKPRAFMPYAGGMHLYRQQCDDVAAKGYPGFVHV